MSLTSRDKKILMALVPIILVAVYWFLVLSPKRKDAEQVGKELTEQQQKRDQAVANATQLEARKANFEADYATVIRLGKAVPSAVDMPSLVVQLEEAAQGTGIDFKSIKTGQRESGAAPAPGGGQPGGEGTPPPGGGGADKPAAPGGQSASSAPGQAGENAGNAVNQSNAQSGAPAQGSGSPTGPAGPPTADPSQSPGSGGGTGGSGADSAPAGGGSSSVPGLDTVPLDFEFTGNFFNLADFFHKMKRFVRVSNERLKVRGRLMTIDSFTFKSEQQSFPDLIAQVKATVYLAPKAEGVTGGATPSGPAPGGPGGAAPQPTSSTTPPTASTTP